VKTLLALIALEAVAAASPLVKTTWTGGANDDLVRSTGLVPHFGGVHGVIEAERYDAPKPGVVLYVSRVAATLDSPASAAQAELANVEPSNVKDPKVALASENKALIASLDWKDASAGIGGSTRMVIAATASKISAVKGECLAAADADAALLADCKQALATLDPGIDPKDRIDLTAAGSATPIPPELKLNDEPLHAKTPPMAVPRDDNASPRTDIRPIIVGLAIIALAAVFYWNRKRRERFAKESPNE
jgi:hypothetical protein